MARPWNPKEFDALWERFICQDELNLAESITTIATAHATRSAFNDLRSWRHRPLSMCWILVEDS